jgi:Carboxypeptidase regulatory-like domain
MSSHRWMRAQACLLAAVASLIIGPSSFAQVAYHTAIGASQLVVTVTDENGVAVPSAQVFLQPSPQATPQRCATDFSGRCEFANATSENYELTVEKPGFYASHFTTPRIEPHLTLNVDVTLTHLREVREVVDVVESPPAIDPAQTSSQEQLTGVDVINLPYTTTRDYRNVLNFIPSVVNDVYGQPHVAGAETYQTLTYLDGFNVTQPANGQLLLRVSTDAFRSINVETSRYSAEYGKGTGGLVDLATGIGDDHFRFLTTDFIPSLQNKRGIALDKLTPRLTFSGPIEKGRVWFFDAIDGEYDNIMFTELPPGADDDVFWRLGNLAKVQANLTSRNILTTSFNYNLSHDQHSGMSPINPGPATPIVDEPVYQTSVKDQHYFSGGELLETGFGFNRYDLDQRPRGTELYFITPETTGGNYYFNANTQAERWQALANLYLAPREWHGRHEFKVGVDLDRLNYDARYLRQPIAFLREGQTLAGGDCLTLTPSPCSRFSIFPGAPRVEQHNVEVSGYAQDRWLVTNRFLVEAGLRYDRDEIVRDSLLSPRLATTYVLDKEGNTKLSAGAGLFYDASPLFLIVRPFAGQRIDYFFNQMGLPTGGPVTTTFVADRNTLEAPRFVNWSLGLERKLPWQLYLKAEFTQKRGAHGFVYNLPNNPLGASADTFLLQNTRKDRYDAFQVNLRRSFAKGHMVMLSYTRSKSRSNQVLDFNVDNPVFSAQAAGPYPWDAPNRFLSWGFLSLVKGFDLGYSTELRSGFPFNAVNDQEQLAEPPGSRRFPTFFTLNVHVEKRFSLLHYYLAVRGGFDNITGRKNYGFVNNDINSPQFLTFSGYEGRAFTARIRFLGRK